MLLVDLVLAQGLLGQWASTFCFDPRADGRELKEVPIDSGCWYSDSLHSDRAGKRFNVKIWISDVCWLLTISLRLFFLLFSWIFELWLFFIIVIVNPLATIEDAFTKKNTNL